MEIKFERHSFPARKDLLHFIEEHCDKNILEKIGHNPEAWKDELDIVSTLLTGQGLVGAVGLEDPPILQMLGENIGIYRGPNRWHRGLWTKRNSDTHVEKDLEERFLWTRYNIGSNSKLLINTEWSGISPECLLPDYVEKNGAKVVKENHSDKRPIWRFEIPFSGQNISIYAKGAIIACSHYYEHSRPKYRLTSLSDVHKVTSQKEMETTIKLMNAGVKVPSVIGIYTEPSEEFLYVQEISGKHPDQCLENRDVIIKQDAEMLARLCVSGIRKSGFTDFDDKVFDGTDLYLIDVEECSDLYFPMRPDFQSILLNPSDSSELRKFRAFQRNHFKKTLKDALFTYRDTLTPTLEDKKAYINSFFDTLDWNTPGESELKRLTHFEKNYMTWDSYLSSMSDGD